MNIGIHHLFSFSTSPYNPLQIFYIVALDLFHEFESMNFDEPMKQISMKHYSCGLNKLKDLNAWGKQDNYEWLLQNADGVFL